MSTFRGMPIALTSVVLEAENRLLEPTEERRKQIAAAAHRLRSEAARRGWATRKKRLHARTVVGGACEDEQGRV